MVLIETEDPETWFTDLFGGESDWLASLATIGINAGWVTELDGIDPKIGTPAGASLAADVNDVSLRVDAVAADVDPNAVWTAVMPADPAAGTFAWYVKRILAALGLL
jgi:hypothetical protein